VLCYSRCFRGTEGQGLTEQDVTETSLEGDVLGWHSMLRGLRRHYADPAINPRERFAVGVAQDGDGNASGIAVTSTPRPELDEVTVRQTGALAYALRALVDERIEQRQQQAREAAGALSPAELNALPAIELSPAGE
jgi:hypothetical protein